MTMYSHLSDADGGMSWAVHLVITRAPSVELAANRSDVLCQPPLIGCVDVLIPRHYLEFASLPLAFHLLQALHYL